MSKLACVRCGAEEKDHHEFLQRPRGCGCDPEGFGSDEQMARIMEHPACSNCEIEIELEFDGTEITLTDAQELGSICVNCHHEVRCHEITEVVGEGGGR